jgi:hypothetical protein
MEKPISASVKDGTRAPNVLLQAKKEALKQASEKDKGIRCGNPWDQGHWANRH